MSYHDDCTHVKERIDLYRVSPLESQMKNFVVIVNYFLYHAPLIDCVLSKDVSISEERQERILKRMLFESKLEKKAFFFEEL